MLMCLGDAKRGMAETGPRLTAATLHAMPAVSEELTSFAAEETL